MEKDQTEQPVEPTRRILDLSIIIPAYNEEENILPLYQAIRKAMDASHLTYELLFIDDGSTDKTFAAILDLPVEGHVLKAIRHRKNFGKSLALASCFQRAEGKFVITMDADLQDDPEEIGNLIQKLEEGFDLVSGWKVDRKDPLEKRMASRVFNAVVSRISGLKIHDFNCGLKAYRNEVVKKIRIYGGQHRFIPVVAAAYGYRVGEIPVKHHKRKFGKSKYKMDRYFSGVLDLFTIVFLNFYRHRPLHFMARASVLPFVVGILLLVYVMIMKFGLGETGNRPSLIAGVFFVGIAFQLFFFGLIAELVAHIKLTSSFDPTDFEDKVVTVGDRPDRPE